MESIAEVNGFSGFKPDIIGLTSLLNSNAELLACPLNTKFFEEKPSLLLCKSLSQKPLSFPAYPYCSSPRFLRSQRPCIRQTWSAALLLSPCYPTASPCSSVGRPALVAFGANSQHCWTMRFFKSVGHHVSWSADLHVSLRASKAVQMPWALFIAFWIAI